MYLYEDQMEVALKEALRIVKPGGHVCLTHFVEPGGWVGSILEPIKKSQWTKWWSRPNFTKTIDIMFVLQNHSPFLEFCSNIFQSLSKHKLTWFCNNVRMGNAMLHLGQLNVFLSEFFGVLGGWSYLKMAIFAWFLVKLWVNSW